MADEQSRRWSRTEVISALADRRLEFFSVSDLQEALGLTSGQAKKILERLVDDRQARRIQRGLYALADPADWHREDESYTNNWYVTAGRLISPKPYYLAYYTAMEIHAMLSHPLLTVFAATTVQKKQVVMAPVRFRFITLSQRRHFGHETRDVGGEEAVNVATLERTFIDCVDRPKLCGGLEEIVSGFRRRHHDLQQDRLLKFVYRLDESTIAKRLGFLLQTVGYKDEAVLQELEMCGSSLGRYVQLVPGAVVTQGAWRSKRWGIDVNVPLSDLQRFGTT